MIDFTKPFMTFGNRILFIEFCIPILFIGITILFRKPLRNPPNLFAFLAPLKLEVWVSMGIAYIGLSVQLIHSFLMKFFFRC